MCNFDEGNKFYGNVQVYASKIIYEWNGILYGIVVSSVYQFTSSKLHNMASRVSDSDIQSVKISIIS